jgi:hypothetical protein
VFARRSANPAEDAFYIGFDAVPMSRIKVHVTRNANNECGFEEISGSVRI